eukprot:CAMPEP_0183708570 /NCGR_PEP_ID=MMETSP0737-20130205/4843_1 /TAXON_ID=385413 /ORGANISM="Thalassiosira miniscula, Strain CCMP1093" /LENGTH=74 /DNA_ID=CAMNT_0025936463 /DNA_START=225 /DNA_END=449 /DNA_ORIENTATION=-
MVPIPILHSTAAGNDDSENAAAVDAHDWMDVVPWNYTAMKLHADAAGDDEDEDDLHHHLHHHFHSEANNYFHAP